MKTVAEPYVRERGKRAYFERVPGQKIAYVCFKADSPKGIIVISHGFTESYRKYAESVYYMLQAGYSVCIHDHRGHGRSYRSNDNAYVVHVGNFEDYVLDLVYMTNTIAKKLGEDLPLYLYGHSMGGCVGACWDSNSTCRLLLWSRVRQYWVLESGRKIPLNVWTHSRRSRILKIHVTPRSAAISITMQNASETFSFRRPPLQSDGGFSRFAPAKKSLQKNKWRRSKYPFFFFRRVMILLLTILHRICSASVYPHVNSESFRE